MTNLERKDEDAALLKLNRGAELVVGLEDALGANAVWDALVLDKRHQTRIGARSTDPLELADALEEMAAGLRETAREQTAEAEMVRQQFAADMAVLGQAADLPPEPPFDGAEDDAADRYADLYDMPEDQP